MWFLPLLLSQTQTTKENPSPKAAPGRWMWFRPDSLADCRQPPAGSSILEGC